MKQVYRVLAFLIAAGVILQAAAIAYAVFAMFEWVGAGGTIDKSLIESESPQIGGITGFNLHQLFGVTILPLLALLLLISSFFAKIPGGIRWGFIVFTVTVAQSLLGIYAHHTAGVGWLHGEWHSSCSSAPLSPRCGSAEQWQASTPLVSPSAWCAREFPREPGDPRQRGLKLIE
jgi:hypothetical protein